MTQPVDRAFVDILPRFPNFGALIKKNVDDSLRGVRQSMVKHTDDIGRSVETAQRQHMGRLIALGTATGTIAAQGVMALGRMATGAITAGVQTAASMEQAQIAFETLLGSAEGARTFLSDLKKFAASTPFEIPGLIDASRQLVGVGVKAKDVIPTLTAYGDAAGALGISQDGFNRIMLATTQAMSAGVLQGGDLRQMMEAGLPVWTLLSKALGKPVTELKKLSEQGKLMSADVLPKLQAQMEKDYGGAMSKQSQTLTGLWSTLMDTFHQGMSDAIMPLAPMLRDVIPKAAGIMGGALKTLGGGMRGLIGGLTEGDITSKGFVGAMERIGLAVRIGFMWFKENVVPALKDFVGYVRKEVVPRVVELASKIKDLLLPILLGFGKFVKDNVLPPLKELAQFLIEKIVPAISAFVGWLADNRDVILAFAIVVGTVLVPAFIMWAVTAASAAAATIAATWPIIAIAAAVTALVWVIIWLVKHWDDAWRYIWKFMKWLGAWFAGPFVDFFKKMARDTVAIFVGAWHALYDRALGPLKKFVTESIPDAFRDGVRRVSAQWGLLKKNVKDGWDNIVRHTFTPMKKFVMESIPNAFRDGVTAVGRQWDKLMDKASTPVRFVIGTVFNDGLRKGFNWISDKVGGPHIDPIKAPAIGIGDGPGVRGDGGVGGDGPGWRDVVNFFGAPAKWLANKMGIGRLRDKFGNSDIIKIITSGANKLKDSALNKLLGLVGASEMVGAGRGLGGVGLAIQLGALQSAIRGAYLMLRSVFGNVPLISGFRPGSRTLSGGLSYHALGRAIDIPPVYVWAQLLRLVYGSRLKELITPWQNLNVWNGRPHTYTGAVWNQHNFAGGNAHIHAALFGGGVISEPVLGVGASGRTYSLAERGPETVIPGVGVMKVELTDRQLRALGEIIGQVIARAIGAANVGIGTRATHLARSVP